MVVVDVNDELVVGGEEFEKEWNDKGKEGDVGIRGNGDRGEEMGREVNGGEDRGRRVGRGDNREWRGLVGGEWDD